jgi:hypothetical protein
LQQQRGVEGFLLRKSDQYRRFAQECLEMARAADERTRAVLVQMAQVWFRLAEEGCQQNDEQKGN